MKGDISIAGSIEFTSDALAIGGGSFGLGNVNIEIENIVIRHMNSALIIRNSSIALKDYVFGITPLVAGKLVAGKSSECGFKRCIILDDMNLQLRFESNGVGVEADLSVQAKDVEVIYITGWSDSPGEKSGRNRLLLGEGNASIVLQSFLFQ